MPLLQLLEGFLRARRRPDVRARRAQHHAHELARVRLVVDDQNATTREIRRSNDRLAVDATAGAQRRPGGGQIRDRRKLDGEDGPAPFAGAFRAHVAAVELDDVTHDREAQPETTIAASDRRLALSEAVEHEG